MLAMSVGDKVIGFSYKHFDLLLSSFIEVTTESDEDSGKSNIRKLFFALFCLPLPVSLQIVFNCVCNFSISFYLAFFTIIGSRFNFLLNNCGEIIKVIFGH